MTINENSFIHKFMEKHSKYIDESYDRYIKKCEYYENLIEKRKAETESSNLKDNDEASKNEKKEVFNKLKIKKNINLQPMSEKVVDNTSQATAIPDSYRVLFGGDKR